MFRMVKDTTVMMGKRKLEELRHLKVFEGQRNRKPGHVNYLLEQMTLGLFTKGLIAVANFMGEWVVVNGQHQIEAGIRFGKPIKVNFQHFECDDADDLWRLYATFDRNWVRNAGHIVKASLPAMPDSLRGEKPVPVSILNRCGSALLKLGNNGDVPSFSVRDDGPTKVNLIVENEDAVVFVAAFGNRPMLRRIGVVMAMIAAFRANPRKATTFFEQVVEGEGLTKKDAAWRLRDRLDSIPSKNRNARGLHREHYFRTVSWWNTFVSGTSRKTDRYSEDMALPEVKG